MSHILKVVACVFVFATPTHGEDELLGPRDLPTAEASDQLDPVPSHEDSAREAAEEILRQRGSIVPGYQQYRDTKQPPDHGGTQQYTPDQPPKLLNPWRADQHSWPRRAGLQQPLLRSGHQPDKVTALREAAWQLDTTAHRLENIDLYEQADALREIAGRLRKDARKMKQHTESTPLRASDNTSPYPPIP